MTSLAEALEPQAAPQQGAGSFKNILLATDFSAASEKAFHYATTIAQLHGSKVYLVHVISPDSISFIPELPLERHRHEGERQLESLSNRSELRGIAHETMLRVGSVWSALSAVIRQADIDLVVLGTHGRGGFEKVVLGSTAEEVVRRASCPVITVGPHIEVPLGTAGEFHRILFATDFHAASLKALESALLLANQSQAQLIFLHVLPPAALPGPGVTFHDEEAINEWQAKVTATTRQKLGKLLPPQIRLRSEPEYVVGFDFTAAGILNVAAKRTADLIVLGANRPTSAKISAHALGAVSYDVICHSKCAVLTVSA